MTNEIMHFFKIIQLYHTKLYWFSVMEYIHAYTQFPATLLDNLNNVLGFSIRHYAT